MLASNIHSNSFAIGGDSTMRPSCSDLRIQKDFSKLLLRILPRQSQQVQKEINIKSCESVKLKPELYIGVLWMIFMIFRYYYM